MNGPLTPSPTPTSAVAAATPAGHRAAREAAQQFETMFLAQMLEQMSSGLKVDKTFGGGPGETVFRSMLNEQYAKAITKAGGIGIADAVYREILKHQEMAG